MNQSWPIIASGAPADRIEASDGANVDDDQNDKWWTIYRLKTPPQKEKIKPTQYPPTLSLWAVIRPRPKDQFHPYLTSQKETRREGRSNHKSKTLFSSFWWWWWQQRVTSYWGINSLLKWNVPGTVSTVELKFGPGRNSFNSACDVDSVERHFLMPYFQIPGRSWKI